ncbi:MAG: ABC transporter permease [Anaerolineales bacterium]|jgi:peptide/nickel transport system permease protein|nr:ABC transporter permease [Anaerolineales bacterium]
MLRYLTRRILIIPFALWLVNLLGFTYAHFARPIRAARTPYLPFVPESGPLIPTYQTYLQTFFSPERRSFIQGEVIITIQSAIVASLGLLSLALVLSIVIGVILGLSAVRNEPPGVRRWLTFVATSGLAMPSFYIGSLLIVSSISYVLWKGPGTALPFPMQGFGWDNHLVLPTIALMARPTMQIAQLTAGVLSGELSKQYITAGRSLGQTWRSIRAKYAMRNILAPVILTITGSFRLLVGELVVVEWLFSWPGLGRLLAQTLVPPLLSSSQGTNLFLDPEVVATVLTIFGAVFLFADLIASFLVRIFDPRLGFTDDAKAQ